MKKILLFTSVLSAWVYGLNAQFYMTSKSHGFVADEVNKMKICSTVEPGNAGNNVVWDFSNLNIIEDFSGLVENVVYDQNYGKLLNTNVILKEYNSQFYFKNNDESLELYGIGSNGTLSVKYTKPFVKMKYPFTYGSSYKGDFEGEYLQSNGKVTGTYEVTGDAYGKLILPGNKILKNVLRVKTEQIFKTNFENYSYDSKITAYRWYIKDYRFPVLVILQEEYIFNGSPSKSYKVAVNYDIEQLSEPNSISNIKSDAKFSIFPNPATDLINISFNSISDTKVTIDIFNAAGEKVFNTSKETKEGINIINLEASKINIPKGSYIVQLKYGDNTLNEKLILQ
jgi:hypothetical protein